MKHRLVALVIAILAAPAPVAFAQGSTMSWRVEGTERTALVFAPSPVAGVAAHPHPVIFAFHGHGGTMQAAALGMHLETYWPDAIVVYPQGLKTPSKIDPHGLRYGWQSQAGQAGLNDRDLKFFDAMMADLHQKFSIDDSRVYATGFSNGAIFSYLLWAQRGKVLAAVGICAGRLAPGESLTIPRPVLVIGGEADPILPFALQQETIELDRQVDSATGAGQSCGPICTLYPSATHTPVVTLVHTGGHIYPPWAASRIIEFFKLHKQV